MLESDLLAIRDWADRNDEYSDDMDAAIEALYIDMKVDGLIVNDDDWDRDEVEEALMHAWDLT